jgi:hypothetical protein
MIGVVFGVVSLVVISKTTLKDTPGSNHKNLIPG